jgi:hypothetical protein
MTFGKQTTRLPSVRQFVEPRPLSCALVSNVYLLLDYSDFADNTADSTSAPYIQLFSTMNPVETLADFVATRLNKQDTTNLQRHDTNTSMGSDNGFFSKVQNPHLHSKRGGGRIGAVAC